MSFFPEYKTFSSGRGSFLELSAARHGGGPPVHHGASVVPGRACSGPSKSRNLARNQAIAFRRAIANQAHVKPTNLYKGNGCCCNPCNFESAASVAAERLGHGPYSRHCLAVLLSLDTAHNACVRLSGCTRSSSFVVNLVSWA